MPKARRCDARGDALSQAFRASDRKIPISGVHATGIGRLRAAMLRYISPILVDSVLTRAREAHEDKMFSGNVLHAITEDCMIGLRLFVKPADLPTLMLELAEILEEEA